MKIAPVQLWSVIQVSINEKERESIQRIQQTTGELFSKSYKDLTEVQIPTPNNKRLEIVFNNLPEDQGIKCYQLKPL